MIDPMVSLAFAMYSNKGAYALLLGSGVSRASNIPTGWEVIVDLVKKVAKVVSEDCQPDPADWYRKKYKEEPNYSKLLDEVAKTATERQQLLRGYFEPNDDERAQGLKAPSVAHKAIAQLAAKGFVKVILTTNFDRLMERALEEIGVSPTVISSSDQIAGALPLTHAGVTIVKIHGDYLDTRIKNTESELEIYDVNTNALLDRILDEYGLIISGWSGDWDIALRAAVERCPTRRFTTFWTTRSPLSERAEKLASLRRATIISVDTADQFFGKVLEKVLALEDVSAPHPLSAKMASATVKRYLVDPMSKIKLHDLIHEETEKLYTTLSTGSLKEDFNNFSPEQIGLRLTHYESLTETLLAIHATMAYWGNSDTIGTLTRSIARIFSTAGDTGTIECVKFRRYPALLLFYAAGLSSVTASRFDNLTRLFHTELRVQNKKSPIIEMLYPWNVMTGIIAKNIPGFQRRYTPASDYLLGKLHPELKVYAPDQNDYEQIFDDFEYLLGVGHADLIRRKFKESWWGPCGRFVWRGADFDNSTMNRMEKSLKLTQENWGPIKAGMFAGSVTQAETAMGYFNKFTAEVYNEMQFGG